MVKESDILEPIGRIIIPGSEERFIVQDKFVVDRTGEAQVSIHTIGQNFEKWFLKSIELPTSEITVEYLLFLSKFDDRKILDLAKGNITVTVGHIYRLLEQQGRGQAGCLAVNGQTNIFYALDKEGLKRAIRVRWYAGWIVVANEVDGMTVHNVKSQLFRRLAA